MTISTLASYSGKPSARSVISYGCVLYHFMKKTYKKHWETYVGKLFLLILNPSNKPWD